MFIGLILAAIAAVLLSLGLFIGPSLDPAVFVQVASEMRQGDALYVDTWDHKPPGIYLLYAAAQLLLPFLEPWLVAWLLSVIAATATGLLIVAVARRLGATPRAGAVAAALGVAAMTQYLLALGGGLTETIAVLPLTAALLFALRDGGSRQSAAVGVLLAVTLLLAIPLLPGVVAVAWLALRTNPTRAAAPLVIGAATPAAAVAAWLWLIGALPAAVEAVVGYSAAYRATNDAAGWTLSAPVVTWTVLALVVLLVPAALGFLGAWREGGNRKAFAIAAMAWIGLSIGLFAYQGRFFAHYAIPLVVPLAVLGTIGLDRLAATAARGRFSAVAAYGPMLLAAVMSLAAGLAGGRMEWLPVARDHERSERVAATISQQTDAEERIWVWGNEPQLYLDASRASATAYAYLYPLVTPGFTTEAMVAQAAADLRAQQPPVIVDAGSREPGVVGFQQLLIPRPLTSDGRDLDILDPLREVVRDSYVEAETVDGWVVYVRR